MHMGRSGFVTLVSIIAGVLAGCGDLGSGDIAADTEVQSSGITAAQRLAACQQDPRVVTGLVSAQVCAGADIFFRETFDGNGRKCGTCHPAENNTTIEQAFIANLHATNPADPTLHLTLAELYVDRGWRTAAADKLVLLARLVDLGDDPATRERLCGLATRLPDDPRLVAICA